MPMIENINRKAQLALKKLKKNTFFLQKNQSQFKMLRLANQTA